MDEFYVSDLAGQADVSKYHQGIFAGTGFGRSFVDTIGNGIPRCNSENVWPMNSQIVLSPKVWNWYVGFFMSMGMVTAAALSFAFGLLLIDWLYQRAKKIESQPTPESFRGAYFNISRFQAIALGVLLAPIGIVSSYYFLFLLVWKLTPNMIDAPPLEPEALLFFEDVSNMASLVIFAGALSFGVLAIVFFLLYSYAGRMSTEEAPAGFIKRFVRRYFQENVFIGFLLMLITFPVLTYFLYNIAILAVAVSPSARHGLTQIAFPNAESLYMPSLSILGAWLSVIIFIPFILLLIRSLLLRWRYIIENPAMNLIFRRSVKYSALSLFGFVGCAAMYYWAWQSLKYVVETGFR